MLVKVSQKLVAAGVVDWLIRSVLFLLITFLISSFKYSGSWGTNLFSNLNTVNPRLSRYLSLFTSS